MTLASHSYASDSLNPPISTVEDCSGFLQMLHGEEDRPSEACSMTMEQGTDIYNKGRRIPTYHLRVDGIPNGQKFKIANRNALGKVVVVFEGLHLGDGKIIGKYEGIGTCIPITIGGFGKGEPSQFLLLDPKAGTTNAVFYLPYPDEPATMNGLKVNMHYVSNCPPGYLFAIENLTPGERAYITAAGGGVSMDSTFIASESGKVASLVLWPKDEKPTGEGYFELRRASGTLAITFPWVRESANLPDPLVIFTIGHSPTVEEIKVAREAYFNTSLPIEQSRTTTLKDAI